MTPEREKGNEMCVHHYCRCVRARELAAMGMIEEAIRVHDQRVRCRNPLEGLLVNSR